MKDKAIDTVSSFAFKLLNDIADEELHKNIYRRFLDELGKIASDISKLGEKDETVTIDLVTAYPLGDELMEFQKTIESRIAKKVNVNTTIDKTLIAGVKIRAYDMVYDSSVASQIETLKLRLKETV